MNGRTLTRSALAAGALLFAGTAIAQGTVVTCESKNNQGAECKVSGGPVVLVRQLSRTPCVEGDTWGFIRETNSIYVARGCRAEFRVGYGPEPSPGYVDGRYPDPNALGRQYYEDGYKRGRQDAAAGEGLSYERHGGEYDRRFERVFAQGYREGWNDQHAKADMPPFRPGSGPAYPAGMDAITREYYRDGYHLGKADGQAHMSGAYQRHQDHYDTRFEPAFRAGYEQGWKEYRTSGGSGWNGGGQNALGVTVYRDRSLRGPAETFTKDIPNLDLTNFGGRKVSSIQVPRGCTAVVYSEAFYRGRSTTFTDDDNNLGNTPVGEDTAMSMKVSCPR